MIYVCKGCKHFLFDVARSLCLQKFLIVMRFKQKNNELRCYGRIFNGDGMYFIDVFGQMEKDYDAVTIRLHTYGGSVVDGNLIFNAINKSKSKVTIIVDGLAASMGAIILMAAEDVHIAENAYVMIHAPSGTASGTSQDLKNVASLLEAMEQNFIDKLEQRTGKSRSDVEKLMIGDHWFDANQAKAMKLVNKVIPAKKSVVSVKEPQAIGEEEVFNAYALLLTEKENINNKTNNMKEQLIVAFALQGVTADSSDTAIVEALKSKYLELQNDKQTAKQTIAGLKEKIKTLTDSQIDAVIAEYARHNNVTDAKKTVLKQIGQTSGVGALRAVLDTGADKSKAPNITGLIESGQGGDVRSDWDWDKWQTEDPRGLEKLSQDNPDAYTELFNKKYKK